jgi:hypothetical protein
LEEGDGDGMLLLPGVPPERPAIHGQEDPLQVIIEEPCPLELTVGPAANGVKGGKPDGNPTLDAVVIAIPHVSGTYSGGYGIPVDRWERHTPVKKFFQ